MLGNPAKYSMVLGENEENSPWDPHHVQYGFAREDNCVTVSFPNSYVQIVPRGTDDQGIIHTIRDRLGPSWRQLTLMVCPSHAATLAEAGWTPSSLAREIERTRPDFPSTGDRPIERTRGRARHRRGWPRCLDRPGAGRRSLGQPTYSASQLTGIAWCGKYRDYVPNYLRY